MRQGIIFGVIAIILSFAFTNQLTFVVNNEVDSPKVVLSKNGEEIYSSPFLYEGRQVMWYVNEDDGEVQILKDKEIIDYYDLNIEVDDLVNISSIDMKKVYKKSGINSEINMIINEDGYVYVLEANCPDKIDVKLGKIYDSTKVITCAPHKLVIKITGVSNKEGIDA